MYVWIFNWFNCGGNLFRFLLRKSYIGYMKKAPLFYLLIAIVAFSSCKEDAPVPVEPTLPSITQTGEHTFGCYVNGVLWLPKGNFQTFDINASYYGNHIQIQANRVGDPLASFNMIFPVEYADSLIIAYNHQDSIGTTYFHFRKWFQNGGPYYDYDAININSGELQLSRFDTVNNIISGTFHFTAIDTINLDTVRVENGRFDMRL